MRRSGLCLLLLVLQFCIAGFAVARNCTPAEKSAADAQLWLNKRDKTASITRNLPWGLPESASTRLLVQRDYVIGYSDSLLVPLWTAHRLASSGLGKETRVDCFRRDPRIPAPAASLPSDYDDPIFDQGHMSPNGDMTKTLNTGINSFIMSNMSPQYCQFNRGVWQIFESLVRIWAEEQGTLYVMTGSVFDRDGDGDDLRDPDAVAPRMKSRNKKARVAVPSHFYKILIHRFNDGRVNALAVMMPNDKTNLDGDEAIQYIEDHLIAVADLQKLAGLVLFPDVALPMPDRASALWPHNKPAARSLAHNCPP
jgi:DNA/RNA endonuclease G (NUC1)